MKVPKQGYLKHTPPGWEFLPGRNGTNTPIPLPNFLEIAESLVHNRKLFQGWKSRAVVLTARRSRITSNIIAHKIYNRHVSAKKLHLLEAPSHLKHDKLHPEDKLVWDSAYHEEYQGLVDIDTWELITDEE